MVHSVMVFYAVTVAMIAITVFARSSRASSTT
jgi:hypothetical protein